jgi:hypothetical protein
MSEDFPPLNLPNRSGPPSRLDEKMIADLVEAIPKVIIMRHVAHLNKLHHDTLRTWLKRGNQEIRDGLTDTIYVRLAHACNQKRSEVLQQKLEELATCPKNYGAITWLLEKCYRDDFETKSEAHKQLEDLVLNYLKPIMEKGGFESVRKRLDEISEE